MRMLDQIVPVILTYDEGANIGRCLDSLTWAREILVVDSYSADNTLTICASYPNVRVIQRRFDCHASQWNFALAETAQIAPWMLAMDADYMLTDEFLKELAALTPNEDTAGYRCRFKYVIFGRILRCGFYPPVTALFRRGRAHFVQDGHTQRVVVAGGQASLTTPILHDDRKSLDRWILSQCQYASLEARKLAESAAGHRLGIRGWLRARTPLSPLAVAAYSLLVRGGIFDGRAGWYYALQRMSAEALICAAMLDAQLRTPTPAPPATIAAGHDVDSEP
jgi:glycosyltransferase involved in cell wall biosynthesis